MNQIKRLTELRGTNHGRVIRDKILKFLRDDEHYQSTALFRSNVRKCIVSTITDENRYNEVYYYRDCFGDIRGVFVKAVVNGIVNRYVVTDKNYYIDLDNGLDCVYRSDREAEKLARQEAAKLH